MWETAIRIEQSETVHGEPGKLWTLVSSPTAWSLWPDAPFMFPVPGPERFRFHIGPLREGTASELFELAHEVPGRMFELRSLPTGRQRITVTVLPGRSGTAKVSAQFLDRVPRQQKIDYERKRSKAVKGWLVAIRAVIEGRARWPGADMRADLVQKCVAQPPIARAQTASASVLIDADSAVVWDAVHSPETAQRLGDWPPIYSGYVSGTPHGEIGEMQYFVRRRGDGQLTGQIVVATEVNPRQSALARVVGTPQIEQQYLLTPESDSGPTRLDITWRWQAPERADAAEAARSQMAEAIRGYASGYKSLVEAEPRGREQRPES